MSDSPSINSLSDSKSTLIIGKVMIGTIFLLFFTVSFFVFLHLYSKWVLRRTSNFPSRRRQFAFATERDASSGLDPSLLRSLPVLVFKSAEFKEGLECAVCLSEVSEGEKARLLPKCCHGFHLECIDMWFQSHSTCPICRNPVASESSSSQNSGDSEVLEVIPAPEMPNLPTNVLFWGAQNQVNATRVEEGTSSSSNKEENRNQQIGIEIPRRLLTEGFSLPSPSPTSARRSENDMKSPVSRLRSLKRLLSGEKRMAAPSSPKGGDVSMV